MSCIAAVTDYKKTTKSLVVTNCNEPTLGIVSTAHASVR